MYTYVVPLEDRARVTVQRLATQSSGLYDMSVLVNLADPTMFKMPNIMHAMAMVMCSYRKL